MNLQERIEEQEKRIAKLERENAEIREMFAGVKGKPIILADAGVRFELNDSLNVIELKNRLAKVEKHVERKA